MANCKICSWRNDWNGVDPDRKQARIARTTEMTRGIIDRINDSGAAHIDARKARDVPTAAT